MINLKNSPFLWFALLLLFSFVIVDLTDYSATQIVVLALLILFLTCGATIFFRYKPGKQFISTLALSVCVITAGAIRHLLFEKENFPNQALEYGSKVVANVKVIKVLKSKQNATTFRCQLT